jgi:putative hydrolase of the HAD superfamily
MLDLCVAFDIDDTLYLERDYVRSGFLEVGRWVSANVGFDDFYRKAWTLFNRGRRGDIFDAVLRQAGIPHDRQMIDAMVEEYRRHVPSIALEKDAVSCLHALRGRVRLCVISDGPLDSQRNKVAALGIADLMDKIVLTDELGKGYAKPHPRAFQEIQASFGIEAHRCFYVADNPSKDFAGPRALGWKSIRVRRRQGRYFHLESSLPLAADTEVPNLATVASIVAQDSIGPNGNHRRK